MRTLLLESDIQARMRGIPGWRRQGVQILADFRFATFPEAIDFVNRVANLAEEANHHPDIDIRWNKVHMALSTHSAGGLTALDFELAERISACAGSA